MHRIIKVKFHIPALIHDKPAKMMDHKFSWTLRSFNSQKPISFPSTITNFQKSKTIRRNLHEVVTEKGQIMKLDNSSSSWRTRLHLEFAMCLQICSSAPPCIIATTQSQTGTVEPTAAQEAPNFPESQLFQGKSNCHPTPPFLHPGSVRDISVSCIREKLSYT